MLPSLNFLDVRSIRIRRPFETTPPWILHVVIFVQLSKLSAFDSLTFRPNGHVAYFSALVRSSADAWLWQRDSRRSKETLRNRVRVRAKPCQPSLPELWDYHLTNLSVYVLVLDLAQRGYFKEEYFVNYLRYLLYWRRPEYAE